MPEKIADWLRIIDVPSYFYRQTGDKVPTTETVRNWMKHGKRGYNGTMTKLRHKTNKGLWLTRKVWIDKFIERLASEVS